MRDVSISSYQVIVHRGCMAPDEGLTVCSVWENQDMGVNLRVKCRGFEVVEGLVGSWLVVWQPAVMWCGWSRVDGQII